ncbi:hypothetical protein O6H91_14G059800 [Diphasiastrum complanatum]|uniref:Uncharacterized protein n=1 Tax=Diphasiastrum complanatum TaxID=34168 RepID=A0ACC2BPU5_DIPCM|nr:hypothetical protein O6H91_14G059800 [Diphasiastrum complanatum]
MNIESFLSCFTHLTVIQLVCLWFLDHTCSRNRQKQQNKETQTKVHAWWLQYCSDHHLLQSMASSSSHFDLASHSDRIADRELAICALPSMPTRRSPRNSASKTLATRLRTFEVLDLWPDFLGAARDYCNRLNNSLKRHINPLTYIQDDGGLRSAAKESNIEAALIFECHGQKFDANLGV